MSYDCRVEVQIEYRTPIDMLEPISNSQPEDLRDAAQRYVSIMNAFARRIESGLSEGDLKTVAAAFWGCAYGLGLSCCDGVSPRPPYSFGHDTPAQPPSYCLCCHAQS